MRSLSYLTVLCGTSTAVGSALRYRNLVDDAGDVVGDLVDAADDFLDAAKVIISKIPLEEFGEFDAVLLEDAIEDPSLIETTLHGVAASAKPRHVLTGGDVLSRQVAETNTTTDTNTTGACSSISTRIEWRDYSTADRVAFVDAIDCLIKSPSAGDQYAPSTSRYEDFARTHQLLTATVHHSNIFLPWHRWFVFAFETALRSECGFTSPMPWWDETLDRGAFAKSSLFTNDYFGSLPAAVNGAGVCITDGKFANLTCNIGPGTSNIPHCLSRAVNETMTLQSSQAFIDYCEKRTDFGAFADCAEAGPHAWAHNGIGSIMSEAYASPSDTIFYMHHLFVDHQWASWQEMDSTRKTEVDGGCLDSVEPCTSFMSLDSVLDMNGLLPNVTVGDVLDTQSSPLCYTYDRFY